MADPNTQIDWWIAQAWQEAQGGADADSLVVWLHENGLTAISSYTILQAALNCSAEQAKEMVFGHPVWAGEAPGTGLETAGYTADTLEPEPEPDPAFELEDWAEEVEEEGPVYGEAGYEAPAMDENDDDRTAGGHKKTMLVDAYAEDGDDLPAGGDAEYGEDSGYGAEAYDSPGFQAPEAAFDEPASAFDEPQEEYDDSATEGFGSVLAAPVDAPAPSTPMPAAPPPPARPPILRMPPATPAERAAVFAAAFGKKPAATQPPRSETPPEPAVPDGTPTSNDPGPAANAETAPAWTEPPHPQKTPQAVAAGPASRASTESEQDSDDLPPGMRYARPKTAPSFHSQPAPAETEPQPYGEPVPAEIPAETWPEEIQSHEAEEFHPHEPAEGDEDAGSEPAFDYDSLPPGMRAALGLGAPADTPPEESYAAEPPGAAIDREGHDADGDFEEEGDGEEPLLLDELQEEPPAANGHEYAEPHREQAEEAGKLSAALLRDTGEPEDQPPPRKRLLLDPEEDSRRKRAKPTAHAPEPQPEPRSEPEPEPQAILPDEEDMREAARRLGIDFRGNAHDLEIDPEMEKTAKELGISFRDNLGPSEEELDETQEAARRLGISFRDDEYSDKPKKHIIAKYMPLMLIMIAMVFLLLIGATFTGDIISWLIN